MVAKTAKTAKKKTQLELDDELNRGAVTETAGFDDAEHRLAELFALLDENHGRLQGKTPLYCLSYGVWKNSKRLKKSCKNSHADLWVTGENYFKTAYASQLAASFKGKGKTERKRFRALCDDALSVLQPLPILKLGEKSCAETKSEFLSEWAIPRTSSMSQRNGQLFNYSREFKVKHAEDPVHGEEACSRRQEVLGSERDIRRCLDALAGECGGSGNVDMERFGSIAEAIKDECDFYDELRESEPNSLYAYARLLPIWILKSCAQGEKPDWGDRSLYDLNLWADPADVADLCVLVAYGMKNCGDNLAGGISIEALEDYIIEGMILFQEFCETDEPEPFETKGLASKSVRELYGLFYPAGSPFDASYDSLSKNASAAVPKYVIALSRLVLHLVVRSVFGPSALLVHGETGSGEGRLSSMGVKHRIEASCGNVAFLAFGKGGLCAETCWTMDFGNAVRGGIEPGPAFIFGKRNSCGGPFEKGRCRSVGNRELNKEIRRLKKKPELRDKLHKSVTSTYCSDFHMGGFVVGNKKSLILVDLGSRHGTCVYRERTGEVFAMRGRDDEEFELFVEELKRGFENAGFTDVKFKKCPMTFASRGDVVLFRDVRLEIH